MTDALPSKAFENTPFDTKGVNLPFPNTPKGFQDTAEKWWNEDNSTSIKFWDIGSDSSLGAPCRLDLDTWGGYAHLYCGGGYVKEVKKDRRGSVCKLQSKKGLQYSLYPQVGFNMFYQTKGCEFF